MTTKATLELILEASGYGDTGSSIAADDYTSDLIDRLTDALMQITEASA